MSLWALFSVIGQLPVGSSAFLVPVSLPELLPGPRVCLQLLVCGVWDGVWDGMFMDGIFLFWFCYLPFVVVMLASFLAAQMFCGFQAKIFENVLSQRAL